jgi:hypothetical protein
MKLDRIAAAACAAALAAAPAVAADLTIVYKTTGSGGPGTATSYFSADKMRMSDADRDMLVEYGPGRIVTIDHKKKEYSDVTLAEIDAAMKERMQALNAQMANMPPAVREKMQGMMGGGGGPVAVTKGATRKVAGYDCQDYDVTMGTVMNMHLCATTAIAPPAPNVDFRRFAFASNPMFKGVAEEMKKVQGFTLAESTSMKVMGRSTETAKEASEVKTGPIPAETFDVAVLTKGYKKVANPAAQMK